MDNKYRATFTEANGELKGTISSDGDMAFVLECIAEQVARVSQRSGVPVRDVLTDIYRIAEKE